ncbi:hypothetical protein AB0L82_35980 [Nocardia sp. NPDC052001]|uniref:hypothetical protein n=1 Tax=Nocardia sp. NPDC052001 TaxID=3154853 RepID=UPI00342B41B3
MNAESDFWVPVSESPYRIIHAPDPEDPAIATTREWTQWGGQYRSVHHAAGYARAHLPDQQPKRIVLVEKRSPEPRPGLDNYRTVTLWEGRRVPADLGKATHCQTADNLHITEHISRTLIDFCEITADILATYGQAFEFAATVFGKRDYRTIHEFAVWVTNQKVADTAYRPDHEADIKRWAAAGNGPEWLQYCAITRTPATTTAN